jgi:hypothetical protein
MAERRRALNYSHQTWKLNTILQSSPKLTEFRIEEGSSVDVALDHPMPSWANFQKLNDEEQPHSLKRIHFPLGQMKLIEPSGKHKSCWEFHEYIMFYIALFTLCPNLTEFTLPIKRIKDETILKNRTALRKLMSFKRQIERMPFIFELNSFDGCLMEELELFSQATNITFRISHKINPKHGLNRLIWFITRNLSNVKSLNLCVATDSGVNFFPGNFILSLTRPLLRMQKFSLTTHRHNAIDKWNRPEGWIRWQIDQEFAACVKEITLRNNILVLKVIPF